MLTSAHVQVQEPPKTPPRNGEIVGDSMMDVDALKADDLQAQVRCTFDLKLKLKCGAAFLTSDRASATTKSSLRVFWLFVPPAKCVSMIYFHDQVKNLCPFRSLLMLT